MMMRDRRVDEAARLRAGAGGRRGGRQLWLEGARGVAAMLMGAALFVGCSAEEAEAPDASSSAGTRSGAAGASLSRDEELRALDPRPSILLVVLDTTRADAISAYGAVSGTTPTVDALAEGGTRFALAFAPSPWTVSSHASLFSGLRVDQHGVGLDGIYRIADSLPLLAEAFSEAGYETAAFVENALLSPEFGFDQGFDHFEVTNMRDVVMAQQRGEESMAFFELAQRVGRFAERRDKTRPAFVFVNIMDAHDPYTVRPVNPFVPEGTERRELEAVVKRYPISESICRRAPKGRDARLLEGLYHGDVAAADAKLARVMRALGVDSPPDRFIRVVTSDHGEHLGENRLAGHRFTVRTPALHVPLVVHGAPGLAPGIVERPVELRRVGSSLLCWALGQECAASLAAPEDVGEGPAPIISIWSDESTEIPGPTRDQLGLSRDFEHVDPARSACGPDEPVWGRLVSLIRYPHKINWAGDRVYSLHDLSWDPDERLDQSSNLPEVRETLGAELERFVGEHVLNREASEPAELGAEAARALKALGYAE